ncbi:MAG: FeS assembly SUF system protein [Bacteroidetes bacterium GWF2_38_335]|nr:MAG: FeS assembly SUF system protein [Bacteroidetes bacterium GWF2_38_335]OFY77963.1 MAG: FeS assembly SUF system protein [Bacteroidetes bacterium RIFOXYA12_FULL_38_20]HBS86706.1 FeS assembly SUF system protein [Bacteroidales bacterium]
MKTTGKHKELENAIVTVLEHIYDPEIPVNILDLGLIYELNIDDEKNVEIVMTLTAPNCPMAEDLVYEVNEKTNNIPDVKKSTVKLVFDPPWDKSMLSDEALLELGLL